MKFLRYVFYDILANFRSRAGIVSMIVMPIAIMTILGVALKNMFVNTTSFDTTKVIYVDNSKGKTSEIFKIFKDESKNYKVEITKVDTLEEGKDQVKRENDKVLLELTEDKISVYENNLKSMSVDYVISCIKGISQRYDIYSNIAKVSPQGISKIDNDFSKDYSKINEVSIGRDLTSFDYYGIVEITMMALYGSMFTLFAFQGYRRHSIEDRLTQTGNSKIFYVAGTVVAKFILTLITLVPGIIYSRFVLKVYWGNDFFSIFVILLTIIFFAVTIGALFATLFDDEKVASMILNSVVIPVICFFGGSYMYIPDDVKGILGSVVKISPLRWTNKSILNIVYSSDYSNMGTALSINMGFGIMFLVATFMILKRREA
ncbi:ABC-2 family transporter protein [Clostridium cavendishii DSM 21758]|uniref:ABC-2 family transporter protein n=1 Tax=Clostridium cavendishii DSM 21758 TaxID=1121302 RepID=A0A1M6J5L5_9CLOT|nr:ABC transporter permease [Clostridium cavendishii]SHJ41978.1 ABC-2 family transporter protein [Clostridium cavendishii DSM 21758]